ncbi:hypothetical protein L1887_38992 [Cichorium endivia]|nr:hypothetical protein L1887_38989 [Cichorium endivia]KAI3496622.1 hypothetical protein L1887_38992 [Cichorium endivia]
MVLLVVEVLDAGLRVEKKEFRCRTVATSSTGGGWSRAYGSDSVKEEMEQLRTFLNLFKVSDGVDLWQCKLGNGGIFSVGALRLLS